MSKQCYLVFIENVGAFVLYHWLAVTLGAVSWLVKTPVATSKNTQNIIPGTGISVRKGCVPINLTGGASWPLFNIHLSLVCSSSDVCPFKAVSTWGCFCKYGEKILIANVLCWPWICVHRKQAWSAPDVTIWTCNFGSVCCQWNRSPFLVAFMSNITQCCLLCLVSILPLAKPWLLAALYSPGVS